MIHVGPFNNIIHFRFNRLLSCYTMRCTIATITKLHLNAVLRRLEHVMALQSQPFDQSTIDDIILRSLLLVAFVA